MRCKSMDPPHEPPSPAPWVFEKHVYGLAHCLLDRDGRVIGSHLRLPNGPLMAEAPVMAELLRNLLGQICAFWQREPGADDEIHT